MQRPEPNLSAWSTIADTADRLSTSDSPIRIAIVGKYTGLSDSYLSVVKGTQPKTKAGLVPFKLANIISALQHASYYVDRKLEIDWIEASSLEPAYKGTHPIFFKPETIASLDLQPNAQYYRGRSREVR